MKFIHAIFAGSLLYAASTSASAQPVPVRHLQGAMRGFLAVRSESGTVLGHGEYVESAAGDRVTVRLTLRFRDGSLDDETTVFTQHEVFTFVSDHHIQRGGFFKQAMDATLEANGQYTLRTQKDGKEKVETSHIDLPNDVSNGILAVLLLNIAPDASLTAGMVLPSGKGRLVKLAVSPNGKGAFTAVTGDRRSANIFRIHVDLGGVAGVVAPLIGKQPQDLQAWVLEGDVPLLVREVGQLYEGGPVVSLELAGTSFTRYPATKRVP